MSSRSADVDFTFWYEVTVRATVEALVATGWRLEEPLSYMVNDNDLFDWRETTGDRAEEVLDLLDAPEHKEHHVALCVYHPSAATGGQLLFRPHRTECAFIPTIHRRELPGAPRFTDLSWYLGALVPPLLTVGLRSYEAQDIAH
ncbi:hypothetical protein [Streptomyces boluensis]|uniref:Uncharacterized protein n=1 Tax=Streptomyces boluensis TaxID=1775135 RepID=A0A964UYD7_9ACTN|nr:hypothetical protein [Streptomyces boluensis]NBE56997.1 hypothetical protein [Streptomyces boluensis]